MISINYNIINGEICFLEIKLVVKIRPGQVLVFFSRFLKHGNLKITKEIRHSIIYYVYQDFFKELCNFNKKIKKNDDEMQDDDDEIQDFNNDINSTRKTFNTVTKRQTNIIRAKNGLKAEDNLSNIKY
ncbi:hypothetical protein RhiirA4_458076 [Rhizophagus irregularis]|uniref:Uncharacterized protein n=1 Tax=Rhizophagus irregularis TaxID=588596 RepID=A0A2I1GBD3_9GLOM|nr:hypothetical protein RhiirA4_458076 [Rhizophagus irregularis]